MATLIADTVKARASFPVAYATDVNIDTADSRSVKKALEDLDSAKYDKNDTYDKDGTLQLFENTFGTMFADPDGDKAYGDSDSPIGTIISYMGNSAPKHYLVCDGSIYNISDYKDLADYITAEFGSVNHFGGDGVTTFAVPDLQGEFLRGAGTNSHAGQGNGAGVGEHQDGTLHTNVDGHTESGKEFLSLARNLQIIEPQIQSTADKVINGPGLGRTWMPFSTSNRNNNELVGHFTSRPTNTSVLYCIKYEKTSYIKVTNENAVLCTYYDNYSTDEKIIGCWVNGKPIYRKVLYFASVATGGKYAHGISNLEAVVNTSGYCMNGTSFEPIPTVANAQYHTGLYDISNTVITFNCGSWKVSNLYAVLEYTKTTDAPNSFTPDMIINEFAKINYNNDTATDAEVDIVFNY